MTEDKKFIEESIGLHANNIHNITQQLKQPGLLEARKKSLEQERDNQLAHIQRLKAQLRDSD